MEDIFDLYSRQISKKAQDVLYKNVFAPELENASVRIDHKTVKKTTRLFIRCRVRNEFDIPDAVYALCKALNDIAEANSLAGASGKVFFYRKPHDGSSDYAYSYMNWDKSGGKDEFELGLRIHVLSDDYSQIKQWFFYDFETSETANPIYFPRTGANNSCVCGVDSLYKDKAQAYMHSKWCPKSKGG
jgi:hypothetical protein